MITGEPEIGFFGAGAVDDSGFEMVVVVWGGFDCIGVVDLWAGSRGGAIDNGEDRGDRDEGQEGDKECGITHCSANLQLVMLVGC